MIINNTPENNAVLSNVAQVNNFAIKATAKSFQILSSGLYANKIRAIIRELSCNAVDSHVAAGCPDLPFDVHLPNGFEPWFSIRDYGVGLNHDQVTNIYTTYFESTKTTSNEFIGALGLGSKSPFSYTDNFTVTAVKDGVCGVYTAFINEQGVPSIALMSSMQTDEPNGVEIKFSVNGQDFSKFRDEAVDVYSWFQLIPKVYGNDHFAQYVTDYKVKYVEQNLIPGVHLFEASVYHGVGQGACYAVMGNIAYPIQIPNAQENLKHLSELLNCNLVLEFNIGELDFQASREGLSYDANTIKNIRQRLEQLNSALFDRLVQSVGCVDNVWERFELLQEKSRHKLWRSVIVEYLTRNPHPAYSWTRGLVSKIIKLSETQLVEWNINLSSFRSAGYYSTLNRLKASNEYDYNTNQNIKRWNIEIDPGHMFVENDTKVGALQRTQYHARKNNIRNTFFVLDPLDRKKPMNVQAFYDAIYNPQAKQIQKVSSLDQEERKARASNVTILMLQPRNHGSYSARRELVWQATSDLASFDTDAKFYYMPLSNYEVISDFKISDIKMLYDKIQKSGLFNTLNIYGVRKADLSKVQAMPNWINLEQFMVESLTTFDTKKVGNLFRQSIDCYEKLCYNKRVADQLSPNSAYRQLSEKLNFKDQGVVDGNSLNDLFQIFGIKSPVTEQIKLIKKEAAQVLKRYPLLRYVHYDFRMDFEAVVEYINLIDQK
jgi:hypothetical protein